MDYPVFIRKLSDEDGGGYVAFAPDLKGCMSVGETAEEALEEIQGAIEEWKEAWTGLGRLVPEPGSAERKARDERERITQRVLDLEISQEGLESKIDELRRDLREFIEFYEEAYRFERLVGDLPLIEAPSSPQKALTVRN